MQEANSFSRLVFHFSHLSLSCFTSEVTTAASSLPRPVPPLPIHSRLPWATLPSLLYRGTDKLRGPLWLMPVPALACLHFQAHCAGAHRVPCPVGGRTRKRQKHGLVSPRNREHSENGWGAQGVATVKLWWLKQNLTPSPVNKPHPENNFTRHFFVLSLSLWDKYWQSDLKLR